MPWSIKFSDKSLVCSNLSDVICWLLLVRYSRYIHFRFWNNVKYVHILYGHGHRLNLNIWKDLRSLRNSSVIQVLQCLCFYIGVIMVDLLVIIVENWEVRILNILILYSKKEILDDQFLFVLIVVSFKITMISFSQFINNYYEPSIVPSTSILLLLWCTFCSVSMKIEEWVL